jgi:hypothetical protein
MSQQLINRSPDLKQLRDEGYSIEVRPDGHLLLRHIPYVNEDREVALGTLVSTLNLSGDTTAAPDHVVTFIGSLPCHWDGTPLKEIWHSSTDQTLGDGLTVNHMFSSRPPEGYADYYQKMSTYARILTAEALHVDKSVTATPFAVIEADEDEEIFRYIDTSSSRAEIVAVNNKLRLSKVAIVGVGGTGSYILDLVAKAPVREIHLYDDDRFLQHNAFRSPGAAALDELRAQPLKVDYLSEKYAPLRRGIVPHGYAISADNADELLTMDFVFLAMAAGKAKRATIETLQQNGVPFIDVGMGVYRSEDRLSGLLRVTTITDAGGNCARIPVSEADEQDEYGQNIQIADLNALNAALAVVKWKKYFGFYLDLEGEHFSVYEIDGNDIINDDQAP